LNSAADRGIATTETEDAVDRIMDTCRYARREVQDLLTDSGDAKHMDCGDYVPDEEVNEIIEILREDVGYKYVA
jgi:hypothetical protein